MPASSLDQVVSLCKRRGFVFPGSAIYGGLANSWDYGPLGVELGRNIRQQWWEAMVYRRDDIEGLDSSIMLNRNVWKYSGHEGGFNDPLVDNKKSKKRYRLDHLLEAQNVETLARLVDCILKRVDEGAIVPTPGSSSLSLLATLARGGERETRVVDKNTTVALLRQEINPERVMAAIIERGMLINSSIQALFEHRALAGTILTEASITDPESGEPGDWTEPRQFNMMFSTQFGVTADEDNKVYLRPETAQGIFINFKHVLDTMRRKPPFGIAQIGKSFRNEITPGNFIFRTREFDQMEMEFFIPPPPYKDGERTDEEWHAHWVETRFNWYTDLGVSVERLRKHVHPQEVLSHYSKATTDIEYRFPGALGFAELEGIANRSDFDLTAHSHEVPNDAAARERLKLSSNHDAVENLTYFDPEKKEHIVPWVIEPAVGVARPMLVFLCEAFNIEAVEDIPDADAKRASEQLAAFLKSVERSDALDTGDKKAILEFGHELMARPIAEALPHVSTLLEFKGASRIELGKKLKGVADKLIETHFRTVLKLDRRLAPIKIAVFPLKKNAPELVDLARRIRHTLSAHWRVVYDDTGAIGKLYRRQDEIGTPYCITVDFQTIEDNTVTVRERDSMKQTREGVHDLIAYFTRWLGHSSHM